MTGWGGLNRRTFPRVHYPCLVILKQGEKNAEAILAHTENFGTGGFCVILKKQLKMFSQVDVELDLLDMKDNICCQGKIVWCIRRKKDAQEKPLFYDTGIEFQNIKKEDHVRIENIVLDLVKKRDKTAPHN